MWRISFFVGAVGGRVPPLCGNQALPSSPQWVDLRRYVVRR
jgi:hypothetical protein